MGECWVLWWAGEGWLRKELSPGPAVNPAVLPAAGSRAQDVSQGLGSTSLQGGGQSFILRFDFSVSWDKETWWEEPCVPCWDGEELNVHLTPSDCAFVFSLASPELQPHIAGPKRDNTEPRLSLRIPQLCKLHVDNHC